MNWKIQFFSLCLFVILLANCGDDDTVGGDERCCPFDPTPSCNCTALGGARSQLGGCQNACGVSPVGWVEGVDESSCQVWVSISQQSCQSTEDAGDVANDGSVPSDTVDLDDDPQVVDTTEPTIDAQPDTAVDLAPDPSIDVELEVVTDPSADNGDPFADRPPGQCIQNSDCPLMIGLDFRECRAGAPGGICACSASMEGDCPGESECDEGFGVCVTTCPGGTDEECPPGMSCSAGRCGMMQCVSGVCPVAMFGCDDDFSPARCSRVPCDEGCPADTTCVSNLCIENRMVE